MRAAIYARKSTEDQELSTEVQVTQATAYIKAKGWTVAEGHLYVDGAISRAEFQKRPGLIRLLNNAKSGDFDAVVIRDESRVGGDMVRTMSYLLNLLESGVRVFYYFSDEEVTMDDPTAKMVMAVKSYASEMERVKTSQRTHEHLLFKAKEGRSTGGRIFGYNSVPVHNGEVDKFGKPKRLYTKFEVNKEEAATVRRIFEMYASGRGLVTIAKTLNDEGVPSPRGRTGSWAPSSLRAILYNEKYRGVFVWNKFQKVYRKGTKVRVKRPQREWLRTEVPELRIIPEDLWKAVHRRFKEAGAAYVRKAGGKLQGRPMFTTDGKYLLSGLGVCGECGGSIVAHRVMVKGKPLAYYCCSRHRYRGEAVCGNDLRQPVELANVAMVNDWARVLTPERVEAVIREAVEKLRADLRERPDQIDNLKAEKARLQKEIQNLVAAVARGDMPEALVKAMREKEDRVKILDGQVSKLEGVNGFEPDYAKLRPQVERALDSYRLHMVRNQASGRQVVKKFLAGKVVFEPVENGRGRYYRLSGRWTFDPVLFDLQALPRLSHGHFPEPTPKLG
jgi:site-specific DNA recombinase